jgi:hypothetical protein
LELYTNQNSIANGLFLIEDRFQSIMLLTNHDLYSDAFLIAAASRTRPYPVIDTTQPRAASPERREYVKRTLEKVEDLSEYSIAFQASATFRKTGKLLPAANVLLNVGDVDSGCHLLLRNGEFLAALHLDRTFKLENQKIANLLRRLAAPSPQSDDPAPRIA